MKNLLKALLSVAVIAIGVMPALAFPDVSKDYWAASQINLLSEQGVIVGYPDGTFKPDANVTRAEFAAMAIRALGQQHTKIAQPITYADVDENYWAYQDIQKAEMFGGSSVNAVDTEYFFLFRDKKLEVVQKRIQTMIANLAGCGLNSRQASDEDLKFLLQNFLNGGAKNEYGTVMSNV